MVLIQKKHYLLLKIAQNTTTSGADYVMNIFQHKRNLLLAYIFRFVKYTIIIILSYIVNVQYYIYNVHIVDILYTNN